MPITNLPSFAPRDIPTVAQMTAFMTSITNAFNASMTTNDFAWPFRAHGDIDMQGLYAVTGLPVFNKRYNLADRSTWTSVDKLFTTVEGSGGGHVVLPANNTQNAATDRLGHTGLKVGSNTQYSGHGPSSISAGLYCEDKSNLYVRDMTINTASTLINCENVVFERVKFTQTSNIAVTLRQCQNVWFLDCLFTGAATYHIYALGCKSHFIIGNHFDDWGEVAIVYAGDENMEFQNLNIAQNIFEHPTAYAGSLGLAILINVDDSDKLTQYQNSLGIIIEDNILDDNPTGIKVFGVSGGDISCNIQDNTATTDRESILIQPSTSFGYDITNSYNDTPMERWLVESNLVFTNWRGIVLGADNAKVGNKTVSGNYVYTADDVALAEVHTYGLMLKIHQGDAISGNFLETADATEEAFQVWDLTVDPTYLSSLCTVMGNHCKSGGANAFGCYTDISTTAGGDIGGSAVAAYVAWWTFVGNTSPGMAAGAGADMTNDASDKCIVANNNS